MNEYDTLYRELRELGDVISEHHIEMYRLHQRIEALWMDAGKTERTFYNVLERVVALNKKTEELR